jgi:hypothetical protein
MSIAITCSFLCAINAVHAGAKRLDERTLDFGSRSSFGRSILTKILIIVPPCLFYLEGI